MINDPPFKTIQTITVVLLASSARLHVKSFAVGNRGKKRDLGAAKWIAQAIGPQFLYPLQFRDGDRIADAAEITAKVEEALLAIRDDLAPMLVSRNIEHARSIRNMVGKMIAKRLTRRYQVVRIDRSADWMRPARSAGKWWDTGQMTP